MKLILASLLGQESIFIMTLYLFVLFLNFRNRHLVSSLLQNEELIRKIETTNDKLFFNSITFQSVSPLL